MICGRLLDSYQTSGRHYDFLCADDNKVNFTQKERKCVCVCTCLAGFAPADKVMDMLIVAYGLCVMYGIHLKFFVLNEALACLHI